MFREIPKGGNVSAISRSVSDYSDELPSTMPVNLAHKADI